MSTLLGIDQAQLTLRSNKNIIWTVEWIGADKSRIITQSSAVEPIYRIHPLFESPTSKKKRKRDADAAPTSKPEPLQGAVERTTTQVESSETELNIEAPESASSSSKPLVTYEQDAAGVDQQTLQSVPVQPEAPTDRRYMFYLLRPRTSSSRRVLVPLTPSDVLGDALRGQTVEEFPTVYYFPAVTTELPSEFMLDEDYRKEEGEQQREFDELMKDVDPEILRRLKNDSMNNHVAEEVDSKRILDVLKQDLGSM